MKIKIQSRSIYGKVRNFPMCEKSELFAKFCGKKCLNAKRLKILKELGYQIELVPYLPEQQTQSHSRKGSG